MNLLESLNPQQREAVVNTEGPILVLAGAGSGKTRVLTHKVVHILHQGLAKPWEILAVTFTNKAAGEMKNRIAGLINEQIGNMWVGTFHSLFARMMRRFGERIGYTSNFAIYDRQDQEKVMKDVLNDFPNFAAIFNNKKAVNIISSMKSRLAPPQIKHYIFGKPVDFNILFEAYEKRMKTNNALDFDDLLLKPLLLLQNYPDIADYYCLKFRYILVDEFQDTNIAQNELLKVLWKGHKNLTVVGDDDQSIYGWRGAELKNILNFPEDYPGTIIIRMEKNYRSTQPILEVAHSVISQNISRHGKKLYTDIKSTIKPVLIGTYDDREEASAIAATIQELNAIKIPLSSIALLYRTNAQSRVLENVLREYNIPYTIIGGLKFYQRKEIKDLLAYLKLVVNPSDSVSLTRVINFPPRGIGERTVSRLLEYAAENQLQPHEALQSVENAENIKPAPQKKLKNFAALITTFKKTSKSSSFLELVRTVVDLSGMMEYYLLEKSEEAYARVENLKEFIAAVEEYGENYPERNIDDFLQEVALVSDTDEWETGELVNLLTLHSAKGLEFKVVFVTGLEDGLFPLIRNEEVNIEEERRLFYVGVTRAKERLYLSYARIRRMGFPGTISMFVDEIPKRLLAKWGGFGAPLAAPKKSKKTAQIPPPANESISDFKRGDKVTHPTFGEGIVAAKEMRSGEEFITVFFQGYGAKKLLLKHSGIKKI